MNGLEEAQACEIKRLTKENAALRRTLNLLVRCPDCESSLKQWAQDDGPDYFECTKCDFNCPSVLIEETGDLYADVSKGI
jgi:Zn ribbon nucleic-acid-binding protein